MTFTYWFFFVLTVSCRTHVYTDGKCEYNPWARIPSCYGKNKICFTMRKTDFHNFICHSLGVLKIENDCHWNLVREHSGKDVKIWHLHLWMNRDGSTKTNKKPATSAFQQSELICYRQWYNLFFFLYNIHFKASGWKVIHWQVIASALKHGNLARFICCIYVISINWCFHSH